MFEVTIKGETVGELASNILLMAEQYQTTPAGEDAKPKATRKKAAAPAAEPEPEVEVDIGGEDGAFDPDEQVAPMPETAKAIVDAGTGKPAPQADAPLKLTFDDVKVLAAKLAAKDTPTLGKLLKKHGGAKLSEVPKANLGAFAEDVMEALG